MQTIRNRIQGIEERALPRSVGWYPLSFTEPSPSDEELSQNTDNFIIRMWGPRDSERASDEVLRGYVRDEEWALAEIEKIREKVSTGEIE